MDKNTFLNDVAIRSFRDQADRDYILARISHRKEFYCQYHWSGLQAVEKYIKAILLFNRIPAKSIGHNLLEGLELLKELSFVKFQDTTLRMIRHFDDFGCNRYLTYSYVEFEYYLAHFDFAIWDIRACPQSSVINRTFLCNFTAISSFLILSFIST